MSLHRSRLPADVIRQYGQRIDPLPADLPDPSNHTIAAIIRDSSGQEEVFYYQDSSIYRQDLSRLAQGDLRGIELYQI